MEAIGILESNSIAKGIEAADAVLKAADTALLYAKPVCPGKYTILFYGDVAAVNASLDAGAAVIDAHLVDSVVIPRIHPQVIQAISLSTAPDGVNAVGVMEFFSVTAAVYAADAAAKAADVTLLDVRLGVGIGENHLPFLRERWRRWRRPCAAVWRQEKKKDSPSPALLFQAPAKRFLIHYCKGDGSMTQGNPFDSKQRIIQEFVPGKQVTMAHLIANPNDDLYKKLGVVSKTRGALGILTITPSEAAIIGADVATKAAEVEIVFVDRFSGSLVICGDVAAVDAALKDVLRVLGETLHFTMTEITRS